MYNKGPFGRYYSVYLMLLDLVAKMGMVFGIIFSVLMGIVAYIQYEDGNSFNNPMFNSVWALMTAWWAYIVLERLADMR